MLSHVDRVKLYGYASSGIPNIKVGDYVTLLPGNFDPSSFRYGITDDRNAYVVATNLVKVNGHVPLGTLKDIKLAVLSVTSNFHVCTFNYDSRLLCVVSEPKISPALKEFIEDKPINTVSNGILVRSRANNKIDSAEYSGEYSGKYISPMIIVDFHKDSDEVTIAGVCSDNTDQNIEKRIFIENKVHKSLLARYKR